MALQKEFKDALDDLWGLRRDKILQLVLGRSPGRPKRTDAQRRDERLEEVIRLAEQLVLKRKKIRDSFNMMYYRRGIQLRGRVDSKIQKACDIIESDIWEKFVYSFWIGKNCIYVGRTTGGKNRLRLPDEKERFRKSQRLVLLEPYHGGDLDRLECLAIHYFQPRENLNKAARRKYSNKCPVCKQLSRIRKEVYRPFRLK